MMSDNPLGGFFGDFQEQYSKEQERQQRQQMENEAILHDLHGFFESLDEHQSQIVASLMRICIASNETAYMYIGLLAGRLAVLHGVCAACGKNHDEQLLGQDHEPS
jgi:hypothetical protein